MKTKKMTEKCGNCGFDESSHELPIVEKIVCEEFKPNHSLEIEPKRKIKPSSVSTLSDELRGYQIGDLDTRSVPIKPLRKFIKELMKYKRKIKKYKLDGRAKTFVGYREIIEIPLEDFKELAGKDLT